MKGIYAKNILTSSNKPKKGKKQIALNNKKSLCQNNKSTWF